MLFASFLSLQKGSACAARAQKDFIFLKRRTDCHGAKAPRNDGGGERIAARLAAVSPVGSVGASASQRCPPDTRTAMTKTIYDIQKKL